MDKPLRICLDARLIDGHAGGLQQVIIGLASALGRFQESTEQYYFLVHNDSYEWLTPYLGENSELLLTGPAITDHWFGIPTPSHPALQRILGDLAALLGRRAVPIPRSDGTIEQNSIDVMHFIVQRRAFLTKVPSLYHPHDLQHVHLPNNFTRWVKVARDVRYRTFCKQASVVPVSSSWVKRDLTTQFGLNPEKIAVIPLAPASAAYPTPSQADLLATKKQLELFDQFILYPAQTWPHKNHIALLEALAWLRDTSGLPVPLIASGHKGSFYPTIERRISELGLDGQVRFVGFVTPLELQCLYKLCTAVVVPSTFEAASFPLFEAFFSGAPAACSNVTSLPEQAGDAALLFDPNDIQAIAKAIERLWIDVELRTKLAERGVRRVSAFSWDRVARIFRAHYRRVGGRSLTAEDNELIRAMPNL